MRDANAPASLGELMGDMGGDNAALPQNLTLTDLPKILGEKMPQIEPTRVGKLRLLNALQIRFGDGFKNIPGVKSILEDFDKELHAAQTIRMNRRKRNG